MSNLRRIDKDTFYKYILDWYNKHGRSPSKQDFMSDKSLPSPRTLEEKLKIRWNDALMELGLKPIKNISYYRHLPDEKLIEEFISEYARIKPSTMKEFDEKKSANFPYAVSLVNRLSMSWNDLIALCGVPENELRKERSIEEYRTIILDLTDKLGHVPSVPEFEKAGYSVAALINKCGKNYNEFLQDIGLNHNPTPATVPETDEELLQMYIDFSNKIGKPATQKDLNNSDETYKYGVFAQRFGGMNELKKLAGFELPPQQGKQKYTLEDVEEKLIELYIKYNRPLTYREINNSSELPSVTTIQRLYKSNNMQSIWERIKSKV